MEYLSKLSASKVGQIAGDALSEGAEEFTEYGAQLFLENLVLDKDTPYDIKQALYNAGIGGRGRRAFRWRTRIRAGHPATRGYPKFGQCKF